MKRLLLIFFLIASFYSDAQNNNIYTSQKGVNKIVNRAFANLVSGQTSGSEIANYASFDPANGSFIFKGSMPLKKFNNSVDSDSGRISFLGIKIEGDLIAGSYAKIFENTVLNTNASVQVEYNFWFGKTPIVYRGSEKASYSLKRRIIDSARTVSNLIVDQRRISLLKMMDIDSFKRLTIAWEIKKGDSLSNEFLDRRNQHRNAVPPLYDSIKFYNGKLDSLLNKIISLRDDSLKLELRIDSLNNRYLLDADSSLRNYERRVILKEYQKNIASLETGAQVEGLSFKWITLNGGIGNKRYYTFDGTLPLASQIQKKDLGTFKIGIAFNAFIRDDFSGKTIYWNIGINRARDNNTSLLSTQQVVQTRVFKNTAGDTVRQVVKNYSAFTDPVNEMQYWELYGNYYFLFGERTSGLHIFPSVTKQDGKKAVSNFGVGYVVSFRNVKKDAPVINAEGYISFIDLFKNLDTAPKFWNRNEIGIRFTMPLNLFNL